MPSVEVTDYEFQQLSHEFDLSSKEAATDLDDFLLAIKLPLLLDLLLSRVVWLKLLVYETSYMTYRLRICYFSVEEQRFAASRHVRR